MNKVWLVVVTLVAAASAGLGLPARAQERPPGEIQAHREYWQSLHISHYSLSLEISCLCGFTRQPYTFEVRDGKLISAVDGVHNPISPLDINAPPKSVSWFSGLTTIDSFFDHAQQVSSQASRVDIQYDPQYGFPRMLYVDWTAERGDEIDLHIFNFRVLP